MPIYQYIGVDSSSKATRGVISASSSREARDQLRQLGLIIQRVEENVIARPGHRVRFWNRASRAELPQLTRELSTLLAVGVSMVEALEILAKQCGRRQRDSILTLKDRVSSGSSLAESMAEQPQMFDELTLRMVEVGENAGNLDVVLEQLADYQERAMQLKDRVLGAMIYPAIVFAASILVSLFLMTVVAPMLLTTLLESGRPLPWPTRMLKGGSDLLLQHGGLVLGVFIVVITLGLWAIRTAHGRRMWQRFLFRVPILGSMIQRQAISRIAMVISTLMKSGIEYIKAAEIAARASKNLVMQDALRVASEEIAAGAEIGTALDRTRVFPPVVVHIFQLGQASGRMEELLDRLAQNYDRQVASLANRFAAVLEPVLIIILAVVVGFILMATLLPILEAGNVL